MGEFYAFLQCKFKEAALSGRRHGSFRQVATRYSMAIR